ncbi:hypothetical protein HK405_010586, partial [Cladochytrium tenue]
ASGDLQERIEREGAESDATYFLGTDDGERRRLHVQALLEDPQAAASVFDSGCGPGSWTLEMAIKFPHATFVGGFSLVYYRYDQKHPSKSPPLESGPYYDLIVPTRQYMSAKGIDVSTGERLSAMCTEAGLEDVNERVAVFPVGWNGPIGNLSASDFRQGVMGASKRVFMAGRDEAEYETLVADAFKQAGT